MDIGVVALSLFLCWQSIGANHWLSFCKRLVVPAWNTNLYCVVIGEVVSRIGFLLGLVGIAVGILWFLEKRKAVTDTQCLSKRSISSYKGIFICEAILVFLTLL